jgi:hypothetical protein
VITQKPSSPEDSSSLGSVIGQEVPSISRDCGVFIFRVKQSKYLNGMLDHEDEVGFMTV